MFFVHTFGHDVLCAGFLALTSLCHSLRFYALRTSLDNIMNTQYKETGMWGKQHKASTGYTKDKQLQRSLIMIQHTFMVHQSLHRQLDNSYLPDI